MLRLPKLLAINVAVTLALLAILVGSAELYLRISAPEFTLIWDGEVTPDIGDRFKPYGTLRYTDNVNYWTEQRANSLGMLDREPPPIRPGECRVAFIGDSFVEADQVPIADKFQVVLEPMLAEMQVRTMAFGHDGMGQINELPYYDFLARPLKPDVVVLVVVSNDIANNSATLESLRNGWHPLHMPRLFAREDDGAITVQPIDPEWSRHNLAEPPMPPAAWRRKLHLALHHSLRTYRALFTLLQRAYPNVAAALRDEPAPVDTMAHRLALLERDPKTAPLLAGWPKDQQIGIGDLDTIYFQPGPLPESFEQALRFTDWAFGQWAERSSRDHFKLLALTTHSLSTPNDHYLSRVQSILRHYTISEIDQSAWAAAHGQSYRSNAFPSDGHWSRVGHIHTAEMLADYFHRHPDLCPATSRNEATASPVPQ